MLPQIIKSYPPSQEIKEEESDDEPDETSPMFRQEIKKYEISMRIGVPKEVCPVQLHESAASSPSR